MTTKLAGLLVLLASTGSALADMAPPPPKAESIPAKKLEALRTAGSTEIAPDDATKKQIAKDKKDKVVTSWTVCITKKGEIDSADVVDESGYEDWDTKISTTIQNVWKFKPYTAGGKAKAVCSTVTFTWTPPKP